MGIKPSHVGPIDFCTPSASSPRPRVPLRFTEASVELSLRGHHLCCRRPRSSVCFLEQSGPWASLASLRDMSRSIKCLSKIPLSNINQENIMMLVRFNTFFSKTFKRLLYIQISILKLGIDRLPNNVTYLPFLFINFFLNIQT